MASPVVPSKKTLQARIVSGSLVLLSGSGLNTVINLVYNIEIARALGPKGFGHATVIYTILVLLSAVTLSFQIIAAKMVAQQESAPSKAAVYRLFHRASWVSGVGVAIALVIFRGAITAYLNLPNDVLIAIIAIGAAFYIPLGARRGYIQGTCGFQKLATNLVIEQLVRLGASAAFIAAGWGLMGVIIANSAAIAIAYYCAYSRIAEYGIRPRLAHAAHETSQAIVFFAGQMIISNCGIILVDHFFKAREAGIYAAVAMVGRVIFSFSQAVMNSTFPLVAGTNNEERRDLRVIATSLLLVLGVGLAVSAGLCIAPAALWSHLFGSEFSIVGRYNLPYLLALYALSTVVYSLAGVVITFEMSYKIANTSWVQMIFSGLLIGSLCLFHSSLREVAMVQLILMVLLFIFVAVPFLISSLTDPKDVLVRGAHRPVRLLRAVSEDTAIAEFLKSDFHLPAFSAYQSSLSDIVMSPNLDDADENAKRRALFYIRHLYLWREIPKDTEWYEAEITDQDLGNIRMFPRAQWRKVANGRFCTIDIAEGMLKQSDHLDEGFVSKIQTIRKKFDEDEHGLGTVLLIGVNETEPLTVLDGNHRLVAAMMRSPNEVKRLRFLCGMSPNMTDCCWYRTNLATLIRYGRNVLTHSTRKPAAELARLL